MATGLLALIPSFARGAIGIIQTGVAQGFDADRIHSLLGLAEIPMARSVLNDAIAYFQGEIETGKYIESLLGNVIPNPNLLTEALGTIRREYSYIVRLTGYDPKTKATFTAHVTITTDTLLDKSSAEDFAMRLVESQGDVYTVENFWRDAEGNDVVLPGNQARDILGFTVPRTVSVLKAGPFGTL